MKRLLAVITSSFAVVILITFIVISCGGGGGGGGPQYSNATLTGVWMFKMTSPFTISVASKFDGNGLVIEDYDLNPGTLPYSYSVQADGTFTISTGNPPSTVTGKLTSSTAGVITSVDGTPVTGIFKKITDLGACQGTWNGQLAGGHTNSFQIIVDGTGTITGGSGFSAPYGGKLFCESSDSTGLLTTGIVGELSRIKFHTGTVVSGATVTISGNYETNGPVGTYTLVK